jgi:predicted nuclease of predicted toxin-antitoxin system
MKLLVDESVDRAVVERLRQDGHTVVYVAEVSPTMTDDDVLRSANDQSALVVTADKDFGELIFRQGRAAGGIVLLRLAGLAPHAKAAVVSRAFQDHGTQLPGAFSVVAPGAIRIRRLPGANGDPMP